ncbi:MAG: hypothetical protein NTW32_21500 [Chloroflexi bacterium]|nr:hypothetical protein [Chloroflexota bacterium]
MPMLLQIIATLLALVVGGTAIRVSTKAMHGWQPGWKVLTWLPVYNFVMGFVALIPAVLLWFNQPLARLAAWVTFGLHAVILTLLLTIFRSKVARQSLGAMTFRVTVWVVILAMLYFL